jgi:hypothetical protein
MRNPLKSSQRQTELNEKRTAERIDEYLTIKALLATWDDDRYTPVEVQARNHAYVLRLRARERNVRNYLSHRATPNSNLT